MAALAASANGAVWWKSAIRSVCGGTYANQHINQAAAATTSQREVSFAFRLALALAEEAAAETQGGH